MQARFERSFITINSYHIRQSLVNCNGVELNVDFIRFFMYLNRAFDIRCAKLLKGPNILIVIFGQKVKSINRISMYVNMY